MSIWILAFLVMAAGALAGWRQGAIRAAFAFVGTLFAWLLAVPVGHLVRPILPHVGASNPVLAWALAPMVGFLIVSIIFAVAAQPVHKRAEFFYRYNAGDLRQSLWERLNTRLGICLGLLNGALYFVLITFFIFNLGYWTVQTAGAGTKPSALIRLASQLGNDLEANKLSRTAGAVASLPPTFYDLADLGGFILQQKPEFGGRLVAYPAFTSLWEREDFQPLETSAALTNALVTGVTWGDVFGDTAVQDFLHNKDQQKLVLGLVTTNYADLTNYLQTGKSGKFSDRLIGRWEFNPAVTAAWMRQNNPKIPASEMRVIRYQIAQAYAQTHVLVAGDNQIYVKSLPKFNAQPQAGQPAFQLDNWKGDWAPNGTGYDLHITLNGDDKFLSATADDLRLTVKDGKNLLVFDRAD